MIAVPNNVNLNQRHVPRLRLGALARVWQQTILIKPLPYERLLQAGLVFICALACGPYIQACLLAAMAFLLCATDSNNQFEIKVYAEGKWLLTQQRQQLICEVIQIRNVLIWSTLKLKLSSGAIITKVVWHHQLNANQLRRFLVVAQAYQYSLVAVTSKSNNSQGV